MSRFVLIAFVALLPLLHTRLARSVPAAGAVVTEAPAELRLWFEGGIEPRFTQVSLHASSGARLALGEPAPGAEDGLIVVPIPLRLAPDAYQVRWQTVGRDGHPIRGEFTFRYAGADSTVPRAELGDSAAWGAGAAGRTVVGGRIVDADSVDAVATVSPAEFARGMRPVRWLELSALAAALGAVALLLLVLRTDPGSPAHERFLALASRRVRTMAIGATTSYLAVAAGRLALESNAMHGGRLGMSLDGLGRTIGTAWGRAWVLSTAAMTVVLVALLLRRRADRPDDLHRPTHASDLALAIGALLAAVGPALTGHAVGAMAMMPLAVFTDWMHVIGASAWIGGVVALSLSGVPAALAQPAGERVPALAWLVGAYHALAVPAIILVTTSGLLSAWLRIGSWEALMRTNYGDLLLFKVYVVAVAALLGAYHWARVYPRLMRAAPTAEGDARRMRWSLLVEVVAGLVILALTAALVTTMSPR